MNGRFQGRVVFRGIALLHIRRCPALSRLAASHRDAQRREHTCQRGVYARFEQKHPHQKANGVVHREAARAQTVEQNQRGQAPQRRIQRAPVQLLGIEKSDDEDGAQVVNDGDGG